MTRPIHAGPGVTDCRVIWEDESADQLETYWFEGKHRVNADTVDLPTDHDDKVTVAAAFVDALGLEPCEGGFRAKPEPPSLDLWVHRNLMPHITTHRRYNALTTEEVVAEAFRAATTDPAAFAEFVTFLPLLSFTPVEEVEQGEVEQSEGEWRTPEEHELADAVRSGVLEFRFEIANTRRWSSWRPATGDAFGRHGYEYRVPAGWSA